MSDNKGKISFEGTEEDVNVILDRLSLLDISEEILYEKKENNMIGKIQRIADEESKVFLLTFFAKERYSQDVPFLEMKCSSVTIASIMVANTFNSFLFVVPTDLTLFELEKRENKDIN